MIEALGSTLVVFLLLAAPATAQRADEQRGVVSLREYIDIRLDALERKVAAQDAARQLAIDKAEGAVNQLKDQSTTFATRDQVEARAQIVDQRLAAIDNRFSSLDGSLKVVGTLVIMVQVGIGLWLRRPLPRATR